MQYATFHMQYAQTARSLLSLGFSSELVEEVEENREWRDTVQLHNEQVRDVRCGGVTLSPHTLAACVNLDPCSTEISAALLSVRGPTLYLAAQERCLLSSQVNCH